MKKILIICFLSIIISSFFGTGVTFAKNKKESKIEPAEMIVIRSKVTKDSIKLRWIPSTKNPFYTYKLYKRVLTKQAKKKKDKKKFKLIHSAKMMSKEEVIKNYSKDYYKKIQAILNPQSTVDSVYDKFMIASQNDQWFGMLFYMAEIDSDLATIIGSAYEDKDFQKNTGYEYLLKVYNNDKPVTEKKFMVDSSRLDKPIAIMPKGVRYNWGVALKWSGFMAYTAFHVYRSEKENDGYIKLTETPVNVAYQIEENGQVVTSPYFYTDSSINSPDNKKGGTPSKIMIKGAKKQTIYYYKISGIDSFGDESPLSMPLFPVMDKSRKPAPVKNIRAAQTGDAMLVSWDASKDKNLAGYNVYKGSTYDGDYTKLNNALVTDTTYIDFEILPEVNYFYAVTTVRKNTTESIMALPALAVFRDKTPPAVPDQLSAIATKGQISLSWLKVTDTDLLGYELYRATSKDAFDWAKMNGKPLKVNYYNDEMAKVLDKKPYFYKVLSIDKKFNRSKFSSIIEIKLPDLTPPKVPVWGECKSKNENIVLNWVQSTEEDIAEYKVYKGRGNKRALLANVPSESSSYTDKNIKPGAKAWYFITAVDGDKNESKVSAGIELKNRDTKPVSLKKLKITSTPDGVLISLGKPDNDFKSMTIQRKNEKQKTFKKIASSHRSINFLDKYVDKNKKYTYKIIVYDRTGNAAISSEINVKTK